MDEPVARILSILSGTGGALPFPNGSHIPGHFYPLGRGQSVSNFPSTSVALVVIRGNTFAVGALNMPLNVRDFIRTGPTCLACLEFLIGGRVGINKGTFIEIVNERSVADGSTSVWQVAMKSGSLWWKQNELKQPIEIQTNGGVMGIKG
jgi:hypothetical protein